MKVIQVPQDELQMSNERGEVLRTTNYFWFMVERIIGGRAQDMTVVEILDFRPLYDAVKPQYGNPGLIFEKEQDYKTLLRYVEEHRGWIGNNPIYLAEKVVMAFRQAREGGNGEVPKTKEEKLTNRGKGG